MLAAYFAIPSLRSYSMKLVTCLIFSDFFFSIANVLVYFQSDPTICTIQGYIRLASLLASIFWGCILLWIPYRQIVNPLRDIERTFLRLLALNLLVSLTPSTLTLISQYLGREIQFGSEQTFCGIEPSIYEVYLIHVPIWVFITACLYFTLRVISALKRKYMNSKMIEYKNLILYPIFMMIVWLPITLDRTVLVLDGKSSFFLTFVHIALSRLSGFVNIFIYAKSNFKKIRNYLQNRRGSSLGGSLDGVEISMDLAKNQLTL